MNREMITHADPCDDCTHWIGKLWESKLTENYATTQTLKSSVKMKKTAVFGLRGTLTAKTLPLIRGMRSKLN